MARVFTTIVLWFIIMGLYGYLGLLVKKVTAKIYDIKVIIGVAAVMLIFTLICRVGFGGPTPLEPTWTYKMNQDITGEYWGLFGFFPELIVLMIYGMERVIDLLFWFFLRLGMEPDEEEDIHKVEFQVKLEPQGEYKNIEKSQTNIGAIEN